MKLITSITFLSLFFVAPEIYAQASCRCSDLVKECKPSPAPTAIKKKARTKCTQSHYRRCGISRKLEIYIDHDKEWEKKDSSIKHWFIKSWAHMQSSERDTDSQSQTTKFAKAIESHKKELLNLYKGKVTNQQYDKFALTALGILGAESTFYKSPRYKIKKNTSEGTVRLSKCYIRGWCASPLLGLAQLAKCYYKHDEKDPLGAHLSRCMKKSSRLYDDLSSGPTQIKRVPKKIKKKYKATPRSLFENPRHAAIATMAFLIELKAYAFRLKKKYPKTMSKMNEDNFIDYLIYLYQGKSLRIIRGEIPGTDKNNYLRRFHQALSTVAVRSYSCDSIRNNIQAHQVSP